MLKLRRATVLETEPPAAAAGQGGSVPPGEQGLFVELAGDATGARRSPTSRSSAASRSAMR